jgi:hypothetical protein
MGTLRKYSPNISLNRTNTPVKAWSLEPAAIETEGFILRSQTSADTSSQKEPDVLVSHLHAN